MPRLVRSLLRVWWSPEFALAFARVELRQARASDCPVRTREWREAVAWLEWIVGTRREDWEVPSLRQLLLTLNLP